MALLYLSNPEQRCQIYSASGEGHVASANDIMLAIETLKDRILSRLRQGPRIPGLDDIVTAAEEVLDGSYVWSVSDFHIHLQKAVQVSTNILFLALYHPLTESCACRTMSRNLAYAHC